jgi:hypothetical protein
MICEQCGKPIAPGTGYIRVNGRPMHLACPSQQKTARRTPRRAVRKRAPAD